MKILLYRWKVFNQDDVKSAIEYFGHEVHDYTETIIDKDDETGFKLRDYAELRQVFSAYDCVFSLNFRMYRIYVKSLEKNILHGR